MAAEASLALREGGASASLASRGARVQAKIKEGITRARRALIKDQHHKLNLQETRFRARCGELKDEINGLKKKLVEVDKRQKGALDAQAAAEAELASLYQQVGDVLPSWNGQW